MNDIEILKKDFEKEAGELIQKIQKEVYNPKRFKIMANEIGFYNATKRLICEQNPAEGFTRLCLEGRKDLAVENLVIKEKYKSLFTEEEIKWCATLLG